MDELLAQAGFHRAKAKAHERYADDLEKLAKSPSGHTAATSVASTAPKMTQTMSWYAKHGSVIKQIHDAGGVTVADFMKIAAKAGYSAGSYGQLYRVNGLLKLDKAADSVTLTTKGLKRLKFAEKYLAARGYHL